MEPAQEEYFRLLRDPRWQKRRLEIFQRDGWQCQACDNGLEDGVEFHVHHLRYEGLPWEAPDEALSTRCAGCHVREHAAPGMSLQELDARTRFLRDKLSAASLEVGRVLAAASKLREDLAK